MRKKCAWGYCPNEKAEGRTQYCLQCKDRAALAKLGHIPRSKPKSRKVRKVKTNLLMQIRYARIEEFKCNYNLCSCGEVLPTYERECNECAATA